MFAVALLASVFRPIELDHVPSPGANAENENILLDVDVPILEGTP